MIYWYDQKYYPFRNLIIDEFIFFKDAHTWDNWGKSSKNVMVECDKIPSIEYYKRLIDNLQWENEED